MTTKVIWSSFAKKNIYRKYNKGRAGGLVASIFAFYFDDPSLNPADY